MCLILLALDCHPRYRLVLAANRDEFHERPTSPAAFWEEAPQLLAGRDLRSGGTWLGITRDGRIAAVTNFREPHPPYQRKAPTRGSLTTRFLCRPLSPDDFLHYLRREGRAYSGFNLLFGTAGALRYASNRGGTGCAVEPGIHALSNHLIDTPWPKVSRGRDALRRLLHEREAVKPGDFFSLLADRAVAPDAYLPDTGVGRELERTLSPMFIVSPTYGTRSSTVILVDRDNRVTFSERTYLPYGEERDTVTFHFRTGD